MDLEDFIVIGVRYARKDARLFTSFVIICIKLGPILSPFKISKIAKLKLNNEEFNILGYIVSQIQENVRNKSQWKSLIVLCKKNKTNKQPVSLFKTKAFKIHDDFESWNLAGSTLELSAHDKYLNEKKTFSHSLVKKRLSGVKTVFSDIYFYRSFFKDISLNKLSKEIYHDYKSVYQANELMQLL